MTNQIDPLFDEQHCGLVCVDAGMLSDLMIFALRGLGAFEHSLALTGLPDEDQKVAHKRCRRALFEIDMVLRANLNHKPAQTRSDPEAEFLAIKKAQAMQGQTSWFDAGVAAKEEWLELDAKRH